jgi:hypothetical protein
MKISSFDIQVFKNFSLINDSVIFDGNGDLLTVDNSATIFAWYKVNDEFPTDFAIFDFGKFTRILSYYGEEPELTIQDYKAIIKDSDSDKSTEFLVADEMMIELIREKQKNRTKANIENPDVEFFLPCSVISDTLKMANILESTHIGVCYDGEKIFLLCTNRNIPNPDTHRMDITEHSSLADEFSMYIPIENMNKLLNIGGKKIQYKVSVAIDKLLQFSLDKEASLKYWLVPHM